MSSGDYLKFIDGKPIEGRVSDSSQFSGSADELLKADPFYLGVEWLGAWLVDHCEGETVCEELVVKWCSTAWAAHILRQNSVICGKPNKS